VIEIMVLSSEEVRQLFPMDEAIAAMEKVFAASARGEAASAGISISTHTGKEAGGA